MRMHLSITSSTCTSTVSRPHSCYIALNIVRIQYLSVAQVVINRILMFYMLNMCLSFLSICPPFPLQGKPVIIAQEGPVDGQVRCIAAGYPVPKISWYFCERPHTRYAWNILHKNRVFFNLTVFALLDCLHQSKMGKDDDTQLLHYHTRARYKRLTCLVFYLAAPLFSVSCFLILFTYRDTVRTDS